MTTILEKILIEVLEPVDLKTFNETSGEIGGWSISITKTGQETAAPTWVMPLEPDPETGELKPFCWRRKVAQAIQQTQSITIAAGRSECDCNVSFPLDGIAYVITAKLVLTSPDEPDLGFGSDDGDGPAIPAADQANAKALKRLQKRASGGK